MKNFKGFIAFIIIAFIAVFAVYLFVEAIISSSLTLLPFACICLFISFVCFYVFLDL